MAEFTFALRPFGIVNAEQDFEIILALADRQVPQDPVGNREWLANRRKYDEQYGQRRHYIAMEQPSGKPVGYAAIEQQGPDPRVFRLYLVFDPTQWRFQDLGEFMYQQLAQDALALGATRLIMIEYADNEPFTQFLQGHQFEQRGTMTYNGFHVIRFEKQVTRT